MVVKYEGMDFPGEITLCGKDDSEVNVMHRSGNGWKWPTNPDSILYDNMDIVRPINPPKAAGNRG